MALNLEELITAVFMLFVVIDAPGNAPLFYFFTKDLELDRRIKTIRKSILVATGILFFSGDLVLRYLGITVDDFKIAGGAILFIYAVLGILGHTEAEEVSSDDLAVVPLATPLLAGPGAITVIIYIKYAMGFVIALASLAINMVVAWILLENGGRLLSMLGRHGSMVLSKVLAILLAAYSIALIREGIMAFIH